MGTAKAFSLSLAVKMFQTFEFIINSREETTNPSVSSFVIFISQLPVDFSTSLCVFPETRLKCEAGI
jgi:hypothetical protein